MEKFLQSGVNILCLGGLVCLAFNRVDIVDGILVAMWVVVAALLYVRFKQNPEEQDDDIE